MTDMPVADQCQMVAAQTDDKRASDTLRKAVRELDRLTAELAAAQADHEAMQLLRDRAARGGTVQLYSYGMELSGGDLWRCQRSVGEPDAAKSVASDPADAIRAALDGPEHEEENP